MSTKSLGRGLAALIRIEDGGREPEDAPKGNAHDAHHPIPLRLPPRRPDLQRAISSRLSRRSPLGPLAAERYIQRHHGSEFDIPVSLSHFRSAGDLTSSTMLSLKDGKLARGDRKRMEAHRTRRTNSLSQRKG